MDKTEQLYVDKYVNVATQEDIEEFIAYASDHDIKYAANESRTSFILKYRDEIQFPENDYISQAAGPVDGLNCNLYFIKLSGSNNFLHNPYDNVIVLQNNTAITPTTINKLKQAHINILSGKIDQEIDKLLRYRIKQINKNAEEQITCLMRNIATNRNLLSGIYRKKIFMHLHKRLRDIHNNKIEEVTEEHKKTIMGAIYKNCSGFSYTRNGGYISVLKQHLYNKKYVAPYTAYYKAHDTITVLEGCFFGPHVSSQGRVCWGNMQEVMKNAFTKTTPLHEIMLLCTFSQTANWSDSYAGPDYYNKINTKKKNKLHTV